MFERMYSIVPLIKLNLLGIGLRGSGSLTMVPAGNKPKRLLSVNHTTNTVHQFIIDKFAILDNSEK